MNGTICLSTVSRVIDTVVVSKVDDSGAAVFKAGDVENAEDEGAVFDRFDFSKFCLR